MISSASSSNAPSRSPASASRPVPDPLAPARTANWLICSRWTWRCRSFTASKQVFMSCSVRPIISQKKEPSCTDLCCSNKACEGGAEVMLKLEPDTRGQVDVHLRGCKQRRTCMNDGQSSLAYLQALLHCLQGLILVQFRCAPIALFLNLVQQLKLFSPSYTRPFCTRAQRMLIPRIHTPLHESSATQFLRWPAAYHALLLAYLCFAGAIYICFLMLTVYKSLRVLRRLVTMHVQKSECPRRNMRIERSLFLTAPCMARGSLIWKPELEVSIASQCLTRLPAYLQYHRFVFL